MMIVKSQDDVVFFSKNMKEDILPVFVVSCVTGHNLGLLTQFLNVLPVEHSAVPDTDENTAEFLIHTKFSLGD